MCSWFCETFCCFLVRFRDSCTRNISTPTHSQSRSFEADRPNIPHGIERGGELSTTSHGSVRGDYATSIQPRPRAPIPQYGVLTSQANESSRPVSAIVFDSGANQSRPGSRLGNLPLRGSSALSMHSVAAVEGGGDIGMLSPPHTPYVPSAPPSPHLQPPYLPHQRPLSQTPYPPASPSLPPPHQHQAHISAPLHEYPFQSFEYQASHHSLNSNRDPAAVLTTLEAQPTASDFAAASELDDYRPDAPPESSGHGSELQELEAGIVATELGDGDAPGSEEGAERQILELDAESSAKVWRGEDD